MSAARDPVDSIVSQWNQRMPRLDASPLEIFGRIERIAARSDPLLRPPFAEAGLASGDFNVLAALRRTPDPGGMTPSELATAMLVTPGAVTKRVDRLLASGLVTRQQFGTDGRAKIVGLTAEGRRLTDRLIRSHLRNEAELLACLTPEQADTLAGLLRTLLTHLEATTAHRS